ncbi:DUF6328 family protein [Streptomyces sp. NPDC000410]|uniref:DUF6328 family protein n=1 Tax=Streptomyces sp. NPDC000410 TaxID=3154254 RepID=UPI003321BF65
MPRSYRSPVVARWSAAEPVTPLVEPLTPVRGSKSGGAGVQPIETETCTQAYADILQEVRIAQTAVQFLLGFLLAVAVTPRFAEFTAVHRGIYVTALISAFGAVGLLTALVPCHRLITAPEYKNRLVRIAGRLALYGLVLLMLAMTATILLVLDMALTLTHAGLITVLLLSWLVSLWFGMPLWHRLRGTRRR